MMWIVIIVVAVLMFKLGVLTVVAAMLSIGLKAALFVIILFLCLCVWRWFRFHRRQS